MTDTEMDEFEYYVFIAEQADLHPVDFARAVEREIDADLPYPVVIRGGEVDEVGPYRPAILDVEDELPF